MMTETSKKTKKPKKKINHKGAYDRIILSYKKDPYMHPEDVVKDAKTSMSNLVRIRATDDFKIAYKRIKNEFDYKEVREFREKINGLEDTVIDIAKKGKYDGDKLRAIELLLGKDYFTNKLKTVDADDEYIKAHEKDEIRRAICNIAKENRERGETIDDLFGDTETPENLDTEVQAT